MGNTQTAIASKTGHCDQHNSDGTATIEATWFNQPWLEQKLKPGLQIVLSGKVDHYLGRLTFQSPEWEELDKELIHTGRLVPIYPLTQGISAKWLRNRIKSTVDYWDPTLAGLPARRVPLSFKDVAA